jgi:hypothetical protein
MVIGVSDDEQELSFKQKAVDKVSHYFTTPFVKFVVRTTSSLVYIGCFLRFLFVATNNEVIQGRPSLLEVLLYFFAISIFLEEFGQLKEQKWKYFESGWNTLDMAMIFCFGFMLAMRAIVWGAFDNGADIDFETVDSAFSIAAAICILCMAIRFLNAFRFNQSVGPMLRIIMGMFTDIAVFFSLVFVLLIGYSFAFYFLLRTTPDTPYNSIDSSLATLYFAILGGFDVTVFQSVTGLRYYASFGLFALYMLNMFIVFLNLLIAMMSTTYSRVQESSTQEFLFLRCQLIHEMHSNPAILPPPLTLFVAVVYIVFRLLSIPVRICFTGRLERMPWLFRVMHNVRPQRSVEVQEGKEEKEELSEHQENDDVQEEELEDWYCACCSYFNESEEQKKVFDDYLSKLTKGEDASIAKLFPRTVPICKQCNQLRTVADKDTIVKQQISLGIWILGFCVPFQILLGAPFLLFSLYRCIFPAKNPSKVDELTSAMGNPLSAMGNPLAKVTTVSPLAAVTRIKGIAGMATSQPITPKPISPTSEDNAGAETYESVHIEESRLGKLHEVELSRRQTIVDEKSDTNTPYDEMLESISNLSVADTAMDTLLGQISKLLCIFDSNSPHQLAHELNDSVFQLSLAVIKCLKGVGNGNSHYDKAADKLLQLFLTSFKFLNSQKKTTHTKSVTVYYANQLVAIVFSLSSLPSNPASIHSYLSEQTYLQSLLSIACHREVSGIASHLCFKTLKLLAGKMDSYEIPHFCSSLLTVPSTYHAHVEELLHSLCCSSDSWAKEVVLFVESFFAESPSFSGNALDFAGVIYSLICGRSSPYNIIGHFSRGQTVEDHQFDSAGVVSKSDLLLPFVEVASLNDFSQVKQKNVQSVDHLLYSEPENLWLFPEKFVLKDVHINGLRKLFNQSSSGSKSLDSLKSLRAFTAIFASFAHIARTSKESRRNLLKNQQFSKIVASFLKYGPNQPLLSDISLDLAVPEEVKIDSFLQKPLELSIHDTLPHLELLARRQLEVVEVLDAARRHLASPLISLHVLSSSQSSQQFAIGCAGKMSFESKESPLETTGQERRAVLGLYSSCSSEILIQSLLGVVHMNFIQNKPIDGFHFDQIAVYVCEDLFNSMMIPDHKPSSHFIVVLTEKALRSGKVEFSQLLQSFVDLGAIAVVTSRQLCGVSIRSHVSKVATNLPVVELDAESWDSLLMVVSQIRHIPNLLDNSRYQEKNSVPPDWSIWETGHPYRSSSDQRETVTLKGAKRLLLIFHGNCCTEPENDWLQIFQGADESKPMSSKISGRYHNFKAASPLVIEGDTVTFIFHSDAAVAFWGVRVFIKAMQDSDNVLLSPNSFEKIISPFDLLGSFDPTKWRIWETTHPYPENQDIQDSVHIPGANFLYVLFDPKCVTEGSCDWLKVFEGNQLETPVGDLYSGAPELFRAKNPVMVRGDTLSLLFHSDGSTTAWGVRLYIYGAESDSEEKMDWESLPTLLSAVSDDIQECIAQPNREQASLPNESETFARSDYRVWETPHPYFENTDKLDTIKIEGAKYLVLWFDPQSQTEPNSDWLKVYQGASLKFPLFDDVGLDSTVFTSKNGTIVEGDTISFFFHSDSSSNFWGVRCYVQGVFYGFEKSSATSNLAMLVGNMSGLREGSSSSGAQSGVDWTVLGNEWKVWETTHPYQNKYDNMEVIQIKDASKLMIVFDPACKTELNYDWIKLFKGGNENLPLNNGEPLSGEWTTGFGEKDPIIVDGDSVGVRFHSDDGTTTWGIRMYVRGIFDTMKTALDPLFDEEKVSLFHRPAQLRPLSTTHPELYVLEVFERHRKLVQMQAESFDLQADQKKMLEQLQYHYKSGSSHALGLLFSQPYERAFANCVSLHRMIGFLYSLRILGVTVPDLNSADMKQLAQKNGRGAAPLIKLIWAFANNGGFKGPKVMKTETLKSSLSGTLRKSNSVRSGIPFNLK